MPEPPRHTYLIAKRALDLLLATPILVLSAPVLLGVALLVRWKLGAPVLFSQERAGLHGRPFRLFKFRTMTAATRADGSLLPDEARLTPFGRFLRSTSLDEIPQILNVVLGDMSLVGPRPLLLQYGPRYSDNQRRRLLVPPGMTGLAQVHGRNALSWEDRFEWDVQYVDRASLWLDLAILFRTVRLVLLRSGISQAGQATMAEFMGSPKRVELQDRGRG